MALPPREEALATIEEGHGRLRVLLDGLTEDDLIRPATIGGGDWSAKDLIGHIAFWEEIALVTIKAWLRGERPSLEGMSIPGNVDELNAWNHERKRSWPLDHVRASADATHRALNSSIRDLSEEQWEMARPFEGDEQEHLGSELGGVLGAPGRPFGHAFAHLADLEAFVETVRFAER